MRFRSLALAAAVLAAAGAARAQSPADPDPARFAGEIAVFQAWDARNSPAEGSVLFVGSSSIRLWNTAEAFPAHKVANRGFGGAHITDLLAWYDETVALHSPEAIVFYCGDNDVADGKGAERVLADFDRFLGRVRAQFGMIPFVYVAIKPSVARWSLWDAMRRVNEGIATRAKSDPGLHVADIVAPMLATGAPPAAGLFEADGLHLSPPGYAIWNRVVAETFARAIGR